MKLPPAQITPKQFTSLFHKSIQLSGVFDELV
jgi:hypothetical protein